MQRIWKTSLIIVAFASCGLTSGASEPILPYFVRIQASSSAERTKIVNLGVSVEAVRSDSVYGLASESALQRARAGGFKILESFRAKPRASTDDFPSGDARFHDYSRMTKALDELVAAHPRLLRKFSIGKTVQGREIWAVQANTSRSVLESRDPSEISAKPGVIFLGNHHAREHVSAEVPLMLLEWLSRNYGVDREVTSLLDSRDVVVIPMVNPDGVEYDIVSGSYVWQRKNMRPNGTDSPGVDLNRNYGYMWGKGGSSDDPSSDVYMGPSEFSEPESKAVADFVRSKSNATILLSYHTFSELILYPWGYRNEPIDNKDDRETFQAMARKMAEWSKYKPEQSSELYIASGDTTDWAYGALGIFAFTFELSPKELWGGGFYPGASILDRVFQDNLKPALYLIEIADNPHRAKLSDDAGLYWLD